MASVCYSSPMSRPYVEVKVAAAHLRLSAPSAAAAKKKGPADTFAVLFRASTHRSSRQPHTEWLEVQRTETVRRDRCPAYVESFEIPISTSPETAPAFHNPSRRSAHHLANKEHVYVIAIYARTSNKSEDLRKNTAIGFAPFVLSDMLHQSDGTAELGLRSLSHSALASIPAFSSLVVPVDDDDDDDDDQEDGIGVGAPTAEHPACASGDSEHLRTRPSSIVTSTTVTTATTDSANSGSAATPWPSTTPPVLASHQSRARRSSAPAAAVMAEAKSSTGYATTKMQNSASPSSRSRIGVVFLSGELIEPHRPSHMFSIQIGFTPFSGAWGESVTAAYGRSISTTRLRDSIRLPGDGGSPRSRLPSISSKRRMSSPALDGYPAMPTSHGKPPQVFYVLYRALRGSGDKDFTPVYRSEVLDVYGLKSGQVNFQAATIRSERLYGMNEHRMLRIEFFHYNPGNGRARPVGYTDTSASSFRYAQKGGNLYVLPSAGGGSYAHSLRHNLPVLVSARMAFDAAAMSIVTRRGTLCSTFSMYATDFRWTSALSAKASSQFNDYVAVDSDGRNGAAAPAVRCDVPRGVSYLSMRASRVGSTVDSEEDAEEQS